MEETAEDASAGVQGAQAMGIWALPLHSRHTSKRCCCTDLSGSMRSGVRGASNSGGFPMRISGAFAMRMPGGFAMRNGSGFVMQTLDGILANTHSHHLAVVPQPLAALKASSGEKLGRSKRHISAASSPDWDWSRHPRWSGKPGFKR